MDFKLVNLKISQAIKDCNVVFSVVIVNSNLLQFCRVIFLYMCQCYIAFAQLCFESSEN